MTVLDQLEIFHGEVSDPRALIYVRLPKLAVPCGCQIAGRLSGPYCEHSRTLPSTVGFRDAGPGETLLYVATMPDPCSWSPELPALYRATFELTRGGETIAATQRTLGLRGWGIRGRHFYLRTERWTPHCVASDRDALPTSLAAATESPPEATHPRVHIVRQPSDEQLRRSERLGEPLLVFIDATACDVEQELRRLGACPAVFAAVFDTVEPNVPPHPRHLAPNLLIGQRFGPREKVLLGTHAEFAFVEAGEPDSLADRVAGCERPIVLLLPPFSDAPPDFAGYAWHEPERNRVRYPFPTGR